MNKWTDLIEQDSDFLSRLGGLDERYLWATISKFNQYNRFSMNYANGPTNTCFQYNLNSNDTKRIISEIALSMFIEILDKNPVFANKLIEKQASYFAQGVINNYMTKHQIKNDLWAWGDNNNSIDNNSYSFWWDYNEDDAEICIFSSHDDTPKNGFIQIPYDTEEDKILAETEADTIVKEFYDNTRKLGDYINIKSDLIRITDAAIYDKELSLDEINSLYGDFT